jgi:hypothetical protein
VSDTAPFRVYDEEDFFSADLPPEAGTVENAAPPPALGGRGRAERAVARRVLSMVCGGVLGLGAVLGVRALGDALFGSHATAGGRVQLHGGTGGGARTQPAIRDKISAGARVARRGGSSARRRVGGGSCGDVGCGPRTGAVAATSDQPASEVAPAAPAQGEFGFEP